MNLAEFTLGLLTENINFMCDAQVRFWDMVTPRYVTELLGAMTWLLMVICRVWSEKLGEAEIWRDWD